MPKVNATRLESFIRANGIRTGKLAEWAGISRTHLLRLRHGKMEPKRSTMLALARAAGDWLGRRVRVAEMFDIGER
jgi:predicted transcriptional regulator